MKIAALENCSSLEQVVELINDEFATDATPEMISAKYAYDSCAEAGYGFSEMNLDAAFDALLRSGAKFDYAEALEIALEEAKDESDWKLIARDGSTHILTTKDEQVDGYIEHAITIDQQLSDYLENANVTARYDINTVVETIEFHMNVRQHVSGALLDELQIEDNTSGELTTSDLEYTLADETVWLRWELIEK
jgi:hypothetical protein